MARIIDIIEAPNQGANDMVVRMPEFGAGDFRLGSQVIVRESQTAVFFRDGKALDTFDAGPPHHHHRQPAAAVGPDRPGHQRQDHLHGRGLLRQPPRLHRPESGARRSRSRCATPTWDWPGCAPSAPTPWPSSDPQMFVAKIVGTQGLYQTSQIQNYLRGIIISKLTDVLGESKKGLFDLPAMFDEIGAAVRVKVMRRLQAAGHRHQAVRHRVRSARPRRRSRPSTSAAAMGAVGASSFIEYQTGMAIGGIGQGAAQGGGGARQRGRDRRGPGRRHGHGRGHGRLMAQAMQQASSPRCRPRRPAAARAGQPHDAGRSAGHARQPGHAPGQRRDQRSRPMTSSTPSGKRG